MGYRARECQAVSGTKRSARRHQALLIVIVQYEPERCVQLAKIVFQNVKNGIRDMAIVISSEIKDRLHPFDSNVEVSAGL